MCEVVLVMIDYVFGVLWLNWIEVDIDLCNVVLVGLFEWFGFVWEGLLCECWIVGDEVLDSVLYGLLVSDCG